MKKRNGFLSILLMTLATVMSAAGVYFFRLPNHFSTGGASGVGILLGALVSGVSAGTFTAVFSLILVVLGFLFLGKSFGWRTIYCSVLFSLILQGLEWGMPLTGPLTDQRMLELVFASILPATASALLLNWGGSTGGTEVIALILKKYTALDTGKALLCVDIFFTGATFFIFDFETGLYSSLGLFIKVVLLDSVLEELKRKKAMFIVTEKPEEVLAYITKDIHRGATVWEGEGAYLHTPRWVILTVMSRAQSARLLGALREIDSNVFIVSENSSEVFGKGFDVQKAV